MVTRPGCYGHGWHDTAPALVHALLLAHYASLHVVPSARTPLDHEMSCGASNGVTLVSIDPVYIASVLSDDCKITSYLRPHRPDSSRHSLTE